MDEEKELFQICVSRNIVGKVTYADILAMDTKLPAVFDQGAIWLCSKDILKGLKR